jgi:hypothetical protein
MTQLVLDTQQAQMVASTRETIEICDPDGKVLGVLTPADEIAEAKRRIASANEGDWMSTAEVLEKLKAES